MNSRPKVSFIIVTQTYLQVACRELAVPSCVAINLAVGFFVIVRDGVTFGMHSC